MKMVMD